MTYAVTVAATDGTVKSLQKLGFKAYDLPDEVRWNHAYLPGVGVVVGSPPWWRDEVYDETPDFVLAVARALPKVFVLCAVRGLASPRHQEYLQRRVSELEVLGYHVEHRLLETDEGYRRLFVVGVRVDVIERRRENPFEWRSHSHPIWWPHRTETDVPLIERILAPNVR